jgi:2-oxoglutarate ferredoxin oxidoreductase subunit alpha
MVILDGCVGQMMEPVTFPDAQEIVLKGYPKEYVLIGAKGRPSRMIRSLLFDTKEEEEHNWKLFRKYQLMEQNEVRYETFLLDDAEMAVLAYGIAARIARGAIKRLRQEGLKVGMIRPITLWPSKEDRPETAKQLRDFCVEMSTGQMIEDDGSRSRQDTFTSTVDRAASSQRLSRIIARHYYQSQRARRHEDHYARPKILKETTFITAPAAAMASSTGSGEVIDEMELRDR